MKQLGILGLALAISLPAAAQAAAPATQSVKSAVLQRHAGKPATAPHAPADRFETTTSYNTAIFDKVDRLVRRYFYDADREQKIWPDAVKQYRPQILASRNLAELQDNINLALSRLHASHCEFVTRNDETFFFLNCLFKNMDVCGPKNAPLMDYTGAIVGGVKSGPHQVRYVLDGSPAAKAGLLSGDEIVEANAHPFRGQVNFWGTSGKAVPVKIKRGGKTMNVVLHPVLADDYKEYVKAIEKSVKYIETPDGTIGYVHDWAGGRPAHDALENVLSGKINSTAGLIFDLRDGYGGNFFDDLDYFYRSSRAYPTFSTYTRNGKEKKVPLSYEKPVVTLINGGSRSGKELLAFSLKESGRSKLVGENTAGAVLGGRLFDLDHRCGLYLAIEGFDPDDVVLEGKGVAPDVEVPGTDETGKQQQFQAAQKLLEEALKQKPSQPPRSAAPQ